MYNTESFFNTKRVSGHAEYFLNFALLGTHVPYKSIFLTHSLRMINMLPKRRVLIICMLYFGCASIFHPSPPEQRAHALKTTCSQRLPNRGYREPFFEDRQTTYSLKRQFHRTICIWFRTRKSLKFPALLRDLFPNSPVTIGRIHFHFHGEGR